ncbi:MAG: diguanylate cyclase, partial [Gammaproteobacteria bacterium]|nr:diguanylate cyclase [Gammaproteobacteria bacterium]
MTDNSAINHHHYLASVLESLAIPVWIFDIDYSRIYWANPSALGLWNANSLDELRQRDMASDMSPSVSQRLHQYQEDFRQGKTFVEPWTLYPKGQPRSLDCQFSGIKIEGDRIAMLCQVLEIDKRNPETLRGLQALLMTSVMVSLYSENGEIVYANPAARSMLGNGEHSLQAHFVDQQLYLQMRRIVSEQGEYRGEAEVFTSAGKAWHEVNIQYGPDAVTGKNAYLVNETNISERRIAQEHANRLAYHDPLTDLPNRANLAEKLEQEIKLARRYNHIVGLLFLDLDRFKSINDTLGHSTGDQLLIQVAREIESAIYETDLAARLGGDEFVCILRELPSADAAAITARKIIDKIAKPFRIAQHNL